MMKANARMQVISQLSDAQEQIVFGNYKEARELINFTKWIIMKCNGNLIQEIDVEAMNGEYMTR